VANKKTLGLAPQSLRRKAKGSSAPTSTKLLRIATARECGNTQQPCKTAEATPAEDLLYPGVPMREDESDWFDAHAPNSHPQAGLLAQDTFNRLPTVETAVAC